jgi:hypothetical protein
MAFHLHRHRHCRDVPEHKEQVSAELDWAPGLRVPRVDPGFQVKQLADQRPQE